jgi:hypothetical protein
LVDDSVTQLVAEDELVSPHVQDVSCEVLLRDGPWRTLAGDDLAGGTRLGHRGSPSKRPPARKSSDRPPRSSGRRYLWEVCLRRCSLIIMRLT